MWELSHHCKELHQHANCSAGGLTLARNKMLQPDNHSTSVRRWLGINGSAVSPTIISQQSDRIQLLNWRTTAYGKQPWTHGPEVQCSRSTAHSSSSHIPPAVHCSHSTAHSSSSHVPPVVHCSLATAHNSSRHSQWDHLPTALHFLLHCWLLGLAHCFSTLSLRSTFFTNNISYIDPV